MPYRIQVIGVGTVGRATILTMRVLGHEVWAYDIDGRKREEAERWGARWGIADSADAAFICTHERDVESAVREVLHVPRIAVRSTTVPGTVDALNERYGHKISHIPEFLRERFWFLDAQRPWRVVIGECCREHGDFYEGLFKPLGVPIVRVKPIESELIKLANNAYLAVLISFWNEVHALCQKLGVDTRVVAMAVRMDPRVSPYGTEFFGVPYGGKCLPKDVKNLVDFARRIGARLRVVEAAHEVNKELGQRNS